MRFRVELSREAQKQLSQFPRDVRERLEHAIDEFEEKDDSQWSNIKSLQGAEWKGRLRKKVGPCRIEISRARRVGNFRHAHQIQRHLSIAPSLTLHTPRR